MNPISPLLPRQAVPGLEVPLVGGGWWRLADEHPDRFALIVFYRGRHCHVCSKYLPELEQRLEEFAKRGVSAIAISADSEERAVSAKRDWKLARLRVGYGLDFDTARRWGLYISKGTYITRSGLAEPDLFTEPALYLVNREGKLYFGSVQTMPFGRPSFGDLLYAVDFAITKNFPARGDVVDHDLALKEIAFGEQVRTRLHKEQ